MQRGVGLTGGMKNVIVQLAGQAAVQRRGCTDSVSVESVNEIARRREQSEFLS